MKTILTYAFLTAALLFAGLWLMERQHMSSLQPQMATLEEKVKRQSERLDVGQRTIDGLKAQRADLNWEVGSLQLQVRALRSATNSAALAASQAHAAKADGSPVEAQPGMEKMLSDMLKNPQMKQMIQQQQKVMMGMMYQPLFKDLNLTPAETEEFMSMMLERTTQGMEGATTLFSKDPQARDEAVKKMAADHEQLEQKLKDFLGEERYAKYSDFNQTVGERMVLNQFTSMNSISEDQTRQLVEAMKEEKRRIMTELGEPETANRQIRDFQALASDEEMNKVIQRQELVNARILERAKGILPAEQLEAFSKFQANQAEMQRMGINMARTMFGGGQSGAAPAGPK